MTVLLHALHTHPNHVMQKLIREYLVAGHMKTDAIRKMIYRQPHCNTHHKIVTFFIAYKRPKVLKLLQTLGLTLNSLNLSIYTVKEWRNSKIESTLKASFGRAHRADSLLNPAGALPNSFQIEVILCWFCEVILWNELRGWELKK